MNDHELDLALGELGARHVSVPVPPALRQRVHAVPVQVPERRTWAGSLPGRRSRTLVSAATFAVAGAIVALVGGLLLTGVLTQPGEEPVPAVGASASTLPGPDAPPTLERTDILPGVSLSLEEAGQGVYRVLGDGVRDVARRAVDVAVSPDGDVWLATRAWNVVRLGATGRARAPAGKDQAQFLRVTPDGSPMIVGDGVDWVLDGDAWTKTDLSPYDECVLSVSIPEPGWYSAVGADGGCWTRGDGDAVLVRIDADGAITEFTRAEIGLEPNQGVGRVIAGPDGTIWASFGRGGRFKTATADPNALDGLLAYDGSSWSVVPYGGESLMWYDALAVDPSGVVWFSWLQQTPTSPTRILSWDGESWAAHPFATSQGPREPKRIRSWPNGVIWFGGVATRRHGSDLVEIEPADGWPHPFAEVRATATGPDGTVWLVTHDNDLYVVTAEAMSATE